MTYDVKTKLKERSKLSDTYCKYCKMKSDLDKIIAKTNEGVSLFHLQIINALSTCLKKLNGPTSKSY